MSTINYKMHVLAKIIASENDEMISPAIKDLNNYKVSMETLEKHNIPLLITQNCPYNPFAMNLKSMILQWKNEQLQAEQPRLLTKLAEHLGSNRHCSQLVLQLLIGLMNLENMELVRSSCRILSKLEFKLEEIERLEILERAMKVQEQVEEASELVMKILEQLEQEDSGIFVEDEEDEGGENPIVMEICMLYLAECLKTEDNLKITSAITLLGTLAPSLALYRKYNIQYLIYQHGIKCALELWDMLEHTEHLEMAQEKLEAFKKFITESYNQSPVTGTTVAVLTEHLKEDEEFVVRSTLEFFLKMPISLEQFEQNRSEFVIRELEESDLAVLVIRKIEELRNSKKFDFK